MDATDTDTATTGQPLVTMGATDTKMTTYTVAGVTTDDADTDTVEALSLHGAANHKFVPGNPFSKCTIFSLDG